MFLIDVTEIHPLENRDSEKRELFLAIAKPLANSR